MKESVLSSKVDKLVRVNKKMDWMGGGSINLPNSEYISDYFSWGLVNNSSKEDKLYSRSLLQCLGYVAEFQSLKVHGTAQLLNAGNYPGIEKNEFGIYLNYEKDYLNRITPLITTISENWKLNLPTVFVHEDTYGFALLFDESWFSKVWQIQAVMNLVRIVWHDPTLKTVNRKYDTEKKIWKYECTERLGKMSNYELHKYSKMLTIFDLEAHEIKDDVVAEQWKPELSQYKGITHFAPHIYEASLAVLDRQDTIIKQPKAMYLKILSRHPSHNVLRRVKGQNDTGIIVSKPTVMRLGSTTQVDASYREINSIQAINNSADKLLMKTRFAENGVKTANWWTILHTPVPNQPNAENSYRAFPQNDAIELNEGAITLHELPYPIVAKHRFGSRGTGNTLLNSVEELQAWMSRKTLGNYIFEEYFKGGVREYRLHVNQQGCFYTCRKMLKSDVPQEQRWFRNDSNSVWIVEENEQFDKPVNWDVVVAESVKALVAVGLDVGAIDLKIQSRLDKRESVRENPEFIVLEVNSAASFAEGTTAKYKQQIPIILTNKYGQV